MHRRARAVWRAFILLLCLSALNGAADGSGEAELAGRFVVAVDGKEVPPGQIKARAPHLTLGIELRQDDQIVAVPLDYQGYFAVTVDPGEWRLEYAHVGQGAEFFEPVVLVASPGERTCVGKVRLSLLKQEDLGANTSSVVEAFPEDCPDIQERSARALASNLRQRVHAAERAPSLYWVGKLL